MLENKMINDFSNDDSGAVTVDWVVLTAAVIALSVALFTTVRDGADGLSSNIKDKLSTHTVKLATDE